MNRQERAENENGEAPTDRSAGGENEPFPATVAALFAEKDARIADLAVALARAQGDVAELRRRAVELEATNARLTETNTRLIEAFPFAIASLLDHQDAQRAQDDEDEDEDENESEGVIMRTTFRYDRAGNIVQVGEAVVEDETNTPGFWARLWRRK